MALGIEPRHVQSGRGDDAEAPVRQLVLVPPVELDHLAEPDPGEPPPVPERHEPRQVRPREHHGVHRIERSYGAFSRSFKLPKSFQTELIEADLRDGVLTLRLPRAQGAARPEAEHDVGPASREVRTTGETVEVDP